MRVAGPDLGRREPVATRGGRPEVLDEDVRAVAETEEAAPAVGVVQVERHTALVGVPVEERERPVLPGHVAGERRPEPVRIAPRRLDLHHVGAEVGE